MGKIGWIADRQVWIANLGKPPLVFDSFGRPVEPSRAVVN
jgi:hypothetical protein